MQEFNCVCGFVCVCACILACRGWYSLWSNIRRSRGGAPILGKVKAEEELFFSVQLFATWGWLVSESACWWVGNGDERAIT